MKTSCSHWSWVPFEAVRHACAPSQLPQIHETLQRFTECLSVFWYFCSREPFSLCRGQCKNCRDSKLIPTLTGCRTSLAPPTLATWKWDAHLTNLESKPSGLKLCLITTCWLTWSLTSESALCFYEWQQEGRAASVGSTHNLNLELKVIFKFRRFNPIWLNRPLKCNQVRRRVFSFHFFFDKL